MHVHDTATATESLVRTTKVNSADAELTQRRRAHDARFDRDVEVRLSQHACAFGLEYLTQGDELGVAGALFGTWSSAMCLPPLNHLMRGRKEKG